MQLLSTGIFRQCRSTALQKKTIRQSLFASRHLPFTIRYLPAVVLARQESRPPMISPTKVVAKIFASSTTG
ncbi:MAG: hypothetical protein RRA51_04205 [Armatimonadota bacterium]|nr:hypothetical protein [Armatimonadota bacterium]